MIHSERLDIWDVMPELDYRKLEELLSNAVAYGHWKQYFLLSEHVKDRGLVYDFAFMGSCSYDSTNKTNAEIYIK